MLLGEVVKVWEGSGWGKESWKSAGDFLNKNSNLLPIALDELKTYQLFLAPSDLEIRDLERIEAGIATTLLEGPTDISKFSPRGIRFQWKREDEQDFKVTIRSSMTIEGLPNNIIA